MKEEQHQIINSKMDELNKYLKIDTNENGWHDGLIKELKSTNVSYRIANVVGKVFFTVAGVILIIGFVAEGETIFGVLIKEKFYSVGLLIIMIATIFYNIGKLELKKERIKTFLLLRDLNK